MRALCHPALSEVGETRGDIQMEEARYMTTSIANRPGAAEASPPKEH
jgi:hypothetical protein